MTKRKFYESVTHYLLYEMPLPLGCEVLVDCGALPGHGALRRPVRARVAHGYDRHETSIDDLRRFAAVNAITEGNRTQKSIAQRIVEYVPGEDEYNTYDAFVYRFFLSLTVSLGTPRPMTGASSGSSMTR